MSSLESRQRKLSKLLALSASPNDAEAEAAMAKCQELMEEWGIRTVSINEETNEADISTACVNGYTKKHRTWESKLAGDISYCFDSEAIIQRNVNSWNLIFIAGASEIDIIVDLYKRLRRIISKMSKEYCDNNIGNKVSLQKSYAFGMIGTIRNRLVTIYKDTPETRALVVTKQQAVNDTVFDMFGSLNTNKPAPPTDRDAFMRGVEQGKYVNLHKSIKNRTRRSMVSVT